MLLEIISLDDVKDRTFRLVTFASQSLAQAFVRNAIASEPNDDGLLAAARMDDATVRSLKQAVCRVANMPRTVSREAGEQYSPKRGKRAGQTLIAAHTQYKLHTTPEYHEACERLGIALVEDETTRVTHTGDNGSVVTVAEFALKLNAAV